MVGRRRKKIKQKNDGHGERTDHKPSPAAPRISALWAWLTLVFGLALTIWAWQIARADAEHDARERFDFRFSEIRFAVLARMKSQEQVLRGARGLLMAASRVSRREWTAYISSLQLARSHPGIQGVGLALHVTPAELARHTQAIRAEGFPDYAVWPTGKREAYAPIVYLEPFDWRNRRAFGYDMFSEPTRRKAMETARDTGNAAITGKVKLVQETERGVQAGFLMYLPAYRQGSEADTVARRRESLLGYVYIPFRMNDLMGQLFGKELSDVRLQICDGPVFDAANLMYDSHPSPAGPEAAGRRQEGSGAGSPRLAGDSVVDINGHPWTLRLTALPEFQSQVAQREAGLVLLVGILISFLLFAILWSQATLGGRATALANRMTAALRESQELFRAVTETANDAIICADEQGDITYFNQAAQRIFGYSSQDALGQPLTMLMPERYRHAHLRGFQHFNTTGEARIMGKTIELLALRRDDSEFPIEISIAAGATAQGRFFTAILRDISDRLRAEAEIHELNLELRRQVDQLAAVNRELESFTYTVSHDLRVPLRAVDGFGQIFENRYGGELDAEGRRLLGIVRDNSRKMGALIDDLLAFSRIGRVPLRLEPIDMRRLVQEVVDELRQIGEGRSALISVSFLPPALGDRALLHQVWMNLLANAIKFSGERQPPRIEVGGHRAADEIHYCVRDNGVGYDMAYAGQLFKVFHRLHQDDHFPGTGVGLAIVQRIVQRHGGRVWSEGKVDEGAVFYFSLPAGEST